MQPTGRAEHKSIDEEACEEQYECDIFGTKIVNWQPVILKLPSVTLHCVAGALLF